LRLQALHRGPRLGLVGGGGAALLGGVAILVWGRDDPGGPAISWVQERSPSQEGSRQALRGPSSSYLFRTRARRPRSRRRIEEGFPVRSETPFPLFRHQCPQGSLCEKANLAAPRLRGRSRVPRRSRCQRVPCRSRSLSQAARFAQRDFVHLDVFRRVPPAGADLGESEARMNRTISLVSPGRWRWWKPVAASPLGSPSPLSAPVARPR